MTTAYEEAYQRSENRITIAPVPKTKMELAALCRENPTHPVAADLLRGMEPYPDDMTIYVLPVTLEALRQNREVCAKYEMVREPSGRYRKCQTLALGPLRESEVPE